MPTPQKLRALRRRSGLTMREVAGALGLARASSYQRYEDEGLFKKEFLPIDMLEPLMHAMVGRGDPPITKHEIEQLFGSQHVYDDPMNVAWFARASKGELSLYDASRGPQINRDLLRYLSKYIQANPELSAIEVDHARFLDCVMLLHDGVLNEASIILSIPPIDRARDLLKDDGAGGFANYNFHLFSLARFLLNRARVLSVEEKSGQ